jgi:hypothetical protein
MPSDSISNPCYYSDGICLLSCPEGTEVDPELINPVCVKKIIPDNSELKLRFNTLVVNVALIIFAITLLIIISILIILTLYYRKKSKNKGRNFFDNSHDEKEQHEQEMETLMDCNKSKEMDVVDG